jgi:hypothetical protein
MEQATFIKTSLKSNLQDWTTEDVLTWLTNEIGPNYNDYFSAHEITGRDLLDLNEDNLKTDLKVLKLHDRKLILRKICELMRMIVENNNVSNINQKERANRKIINIVYKNEAVKFKCAGGNRISNIIQDCIDIFGLPKDKHCIFLSDKNGFILPRDSILIDCIEEDEGNIYIMINKDLNFSNEITNTLNDKNYSSKNKSSILQETAIKNKFLSFEALDNFEKNGYSFAIKKNLKKNFEDKVTINSFYNISNLNNFEKSMFNSTENKNSYINSLESDHNVKAKKKNKFTCIRSKKKIDIEDLSEELEDKAKNNNNDHIKITDYKNYENNPPTCARPKNTSRPNISQDGNNLNYKNNYFDRLYNYYNDANKIKGSSKGEIETENEINNFLKSVKSKLMFIIESSTFMIPQEDENKDSQLKSYIQETKKYKNSMKSNLKNFVLKKINSSSNEKHLNNDSSISN